MARKGHGRSREVTAAVAVGHGDESRSAEEPYRTRPLSSCGGGARRGFAIQRDSIGPA